MIRIKVNQFNDTAIVTLTGRLVAGGETSRFREKMQEIIGRNDRIILDMERVDMIDCCGLGELVHCEALARQAGSTIIISDFPRHIGELLVITRLSTLFQFGNADISRAA
jgi:anti-anti-sigma factor